jgi:hypothetical protein
MKRATVAAVVVGLGLVIAGRPARGDNYRLRADAYGASTPATGFVVLQAEEREPSWMDAEALVWAGSGDRPGDVVVMTVRVRDPEGRGEARIGRMLLTTGAVRPLHMDGGIVTARSPWGPSLELFGGVPVVPAFGVRSFDWALGGRLSTRFDESATFGVSHLHQRDEGRIAYQELGLDAAFAPARWIDAAMLTALDVARSGVADARASVAVRGTPGRLEAFATRRSPARLLPATSLFAALGDRPSDELGLSGLWKAAPRLDVLATSAIDSIAGELGARQSLRGTLRLDDRGDGVLSLEGRRQSVPDASWTGARATLSIPIVPRLRGATELEVAVPDPVDDAVVDRGSVWPWGLVALTWSITEGWELAGAAEASSSPTHTAAFGGLARLSTVWGGR